MIAPGIGEIAALRTFRGQLDSHLIADGCGSFRVS
jgi:hypothetical protein